LAAPFACSAGIEAASPLPARRVGRVAGPLRDRADLDVTVIDLPGLLFSVRIAVAGEPVSKKKKEPKVRRSEISDFTDLHKEWFDESPRGIILTAAAYLDDRLGEMLKAFLVENAGAIKLTDGFNAPLGTFSSRIAAAFALGLISSKEYDMLELFREIRNKYAHEIKIRITDQSVTKLARQFIKKAVDEGWEPRSGKEEEDSC
jgi:hypothetical protein